MTILTISNIDRERRKRIPSLPKNLIEALNNREIRTVEGESFLILIW